MALTATTLSSAVAVNDTSIKVASATGFSVGNFIRVNGERMKMASAAVGTRIPVVRGVDGSVQSAHATSSKVITGLGSDFPAPESGSASPVGFPMQVNRPVYSYSASGALTPSEGLHLLNGTSALAMTLAVPTTLQDGEIMTILANGKAAHTVTVATAVGDGGSNLDLWTFAAGAQNCMQLIAANAIWVLLPSVYAGTLTNATITAS